MDPTEQKLVSDVERHGWHVIHVLGDDEYPNFSYTVGLYDTFEHPEIILIGLKQEITNVLLNNMGVDIKEGKGFEPGQFYQGILDNFQCWIGEVPKSEYGAHVGFGLWYYDGDNFPLVQCVYPSTNNVYPWEREFPEDSKFWARMLTAPPGESDLP
ncbi:MAG: DUF4262 domain-containing protein [Gammaproteobacteria bacterium]|nr:DUF4262 domain-containing protein [Gammaproteobacteria bacterium]